MAEPSTTNPSSRTWMVRGLLLVASLVAAVSIFAIWANRQLLDTARWTETSSKMLEDPAIRAQVASFLTEEVYATVNGEFRGGLEGALPERLAPFVGPVTAQLRNALKDAAYDGLGKPGVRKLWSGANELTHRQFVNLVEDRGNAIRLPGGGAVILDLRPLASDIAERAGLPGILSQRLPADIARVKILDADQLTTLQSVAKTLKSLAVVLPVLTILLLMLAVYLARGRRREALQSAGLVLVFSGLFVLALRGVAGTYVVNALVEDDSVKTAADSVWQIGTSLLIDIAGACVFLGVPVVLAAILAGPSKAATWTRQRIAPVLKGRPGLTYGAVAVALVLLVWWAPIPATRSLFPMLLITALSFFGMAALRRETDREFPTDAP